MRIWIKFTKEEPLKFLSHLDLMRAFQRAVRRAALPISYTAGFNPHQRIAFASALPVGVTSSGEYLDIIFDRPVSEEEIMRLQSALPGGINLRERRVITDNVPSLMSLVGAASWLLPLSRDDAPKAESSVTSLLESQTLTVERESKKGRKKIDVRPYIFNLEVRGNINERSLSMLLGVGEAGGTKPQEIAGLLGFPKEGLDRTALFIRVGNCLQSPLDVVLNKNEVLIDAKKDYYQL